jgi:hypothetical protein
VTGVTMAGLAFQPRVAVAQRTVPGTLPARIAARIAEVRGATGTVTVSGEAR